MDVEDSDLSLSSGSLSIHVGGVPSFSRKNVGGTLMRREMSRNVHLGNFYNKRNVMARSPALKTAH